MFISFLFPFFSSYSHVNKLLLFNLNKHVMDVKKNSIVLLWFYSQNLQLRALHGDTDDHMVFSGRLISVRMIALKSGAP